MGTDISINLATARSQTIDKLEDETGLNNFVQVAEEWLTLNEAAVLALILWVLICYFAVLAILLPRQRRIFSWVMVVLGVFLVIGVFSIANRLYTAWQYPPAVIVAQEVEITSGPGGADQYRVEFGRFFCNTDFKHGFLGHAYVGQWVNLGALTTNRVPRWPP